MKALLILLLVIICQSCEITKIEPKIESKEKLAPIDSTVKKPSPHSNGGINDWKTDSTEYVTHTTPCDRFKYTF